MEKLKNVLSHGHRKSVDATQQGNDSASTDRSSHTTTTGVLSGEGTHLESAKAAPTGTDSTEDYHPIYDQFTGQSRPTTIGEPTNVADQAPHISNSPRTSNPPDSAKDFEPSATQTESTPSSSIRPNTTLDRPGTMTDELSTASIKSGVMGFPQGGSQHAALQSNPSLNTTQAEGASTLPNRDTTSEQEMPSHVGRDAAIGAGTIGTGAAATHELHRQPHHDNLRAEPEQTNTTTTTAPSTWQASEKDIAQPSSGRAAQQPFERSFQEPGVNTDTDRSFPLAGGVTSRKQAEHPSTSAPVQSQSHVPVTNEREPGTKEKNVGLTDSQGREALAGAAAAYSALPPRSEQTPPQHTREIRETPGITGGGPTNLSNEPRPEHKQTHDAPTREALAGATAAASTVPSYEKTRPEKAHPENKHTHDGHTREALAGATVAASTVPSSEKARSEHAPFEQKSSIDPCISDDKPSSARMFTSGPHATDTANRLDPHIHVPGEFPETPMETPGERGQGAGGYVTQNTRQPETKAVEPSTQAQADDKHSYGRDAAIVGGVGAAGIGAYSATKHHQHEKTDIEEEAMPTQASPYSAAKLDPRVDAKPARFEEQRFDPTAPTEPSPHGSQQQAAATVSSSETTTSPIPHREPVQPPAGEQSQSKEKDHHYGRDAGLAGAGAATVGGLYYASQRDEKTDSGPASATIGPHKSNVANILDPRVQPDPALQKHHQAGPTPGDPATKTVGPHKSNIANIVDPRVQPEPEKQKGHTTTGPHKSDTLNRLDPRADSKDQPEDQPEDQHHPGRDAAVIGGTGAATYGAYEAAKTYDQHRSTQPTSLMDEQRYDPHARGAHDPNQPSQHHYGRDLAVGGGLGAAGARVLAHEGSKEGEESAHNPPASTSQDYVPGQTAAQPQVHQETVQPSGHQRYDSVQDPNKQHYGRDVAAAGTAAGVTGAGAGYVYSQQQAKEAEKEKLLAQQKSDAKELERQQKEQQKEFEKKQKEQEKAFQKKEKEIEKHQAKEQKHHNKLVAAEEKAHQKEIEKEQHKHQEAENVENKEDGKEKKHHLFGFLHRDKDKKKQSPEGSPRQSKDSPRHSREFAGAATGAAAAAHEEHEGRNRLHKDPPKGHPAREAMEAVGKQEHMGTDGPIGRSDQISGDYETQPGVYGAHPIDDQKHLVTEPHTGLPMNTEKYGDGHGGTDGSNTVGGYHEAPRAQDQNISGQHGVTDWDAIKKANTPY